MSSKQLNSRTLQALRAQSLWWMDAAAAVLINSKVDDDAFDRGLRMIWNAFVLNDNHLRRKIHLNSYDAVELTARMVFRRRWLADCVTARDKLRRGLSVDDDVAADSREERQS